MKVTFKRNKQVHENTNESRMLNASKCLGACAKYCSGDDDAIRDLMADLLHYADCKGYRTMDILRDAIDNWQTER